MRKTVYRDKWIKIERYTQKVRGKQATFTRILHHNGAVVLPILKDGSILMERQLRHAIGKYLYEIPAGHIEEGESPLATAKRELEEETGYKAEKMKFMFKYYDSPGSSPKLLYYYYATGLERIGKTKFDNTEEIKIAKFSEKSLDQMIKTNKILDHKTIGAYLFYKRYIQGRK